MGVLDNICSSASVPADGGGIPGVCGGGRGGGAPKVIRDLWPPLDMDTEMQRVSQKYGESWVEEYG